MASVTLDELVVIINAQTKNFKSEIAGINQQLEEVAREAEGTSNVASRAFDKVSKAAKVAAVAGIAALSAATVAAGKASWDQVNAVQQAAATLGRYYDSAEEVTQVQQELIKYAQSDMGVLFNRKDLFAAAGNLAMYGSNAKDVTKQVEILSRGMASNVLSWDEMNAVVGRVISSGKLSRTEFEMLAKAGYNLDGSLANTSVTAEELFDILDNSIPKDISQDMDNIVPVGIRLQTAFRGIGNAILGVNDLQDGFMPGSLGKRIIDVMKKLTEFANRVAPMVREAVTRVMEVFDRFVSAAFKLGSDIVSFLSPAVIGLYNAFMNNLVPAIMIALQNIQPFVTLLGQTAVVALYGLIQAITFVVDIVSALVFALTSNQVVFLTLTTAIAGVVAALTIMHLLLIAKSAVVATYTTLTVALSAVQALQAQGLGLLQAAWVALNIAMNMSPIGLITIAVGLLVGALGGLMLAANAQNEKTRETISLEERERQLREMSKTAINNQEAALRGYTDAKAEQTNAALALMNAEDQQTAAAGRLNDMIRNGVDPASREYQRAQLELEAANNRVTSAQDELSSSGSEAQKQYDKVTDAAWANIRAGKEDELQKLAQAGKYGEVNKKLRDLATSTTEYKDANGNMTKMSGEDMERMALTIGDSITKVNKDYGKFWDASQETVDKAAKNVDKVKADFERSGSNFSQGLAHGILSNSWRAENAAVSTANKANAAFNRTLDIHSPSRVMEKGGGFFSMGIAEGIASKTELVTSAAKSIAEAAATSVDFSAMDTSLNLPTSKDLKGSLDVGFNAKLSGVIDRNTHVTVNVGGERLVDTIIDGINGKSFMGNGSVIDV